MTFFIIRDFFFLNSNLTAVLLIPRFYDFFKSWELNLSYSPFEHLLLNRIFFFLIVFSFFESDSSHLSGTVLVSSWKLGVLFIL